MTSENARAELDADRVRILPLGGLGEIGMNCMAIEQRGPGGPEVLLVDCGVSFDDRGLGIDVVHPDFSALEAYRDRIAGVVLTHGHEDHIGALPYLLRRFDVPVYGPRYALGLVRERLDEHEVLAHAKLVETTPRAPFKVGGFEVEPIRVTHSIADATALAIGTRAGRIVHTGDFKFDEDPMDGETFDVERLRALGDDGVSLLLSDSTNVDAEGRAGDERSVEAALDAIVGEARGAVVVAMFASNVHRLRILGAVARRANRRLVMLGRSVRTHARVARATGYLDWPDDLVFPAERARELPRETILGIATGSQGEPGAALHRLAHGEHPALDLLEGDTVILSSRVIPGRDPEVHALVCDLLRRGVVVRTRATDRAVHVSGHAHRDEQRRMIDLVRPRGFVPVHGTLHHLIRHADLARAAGVADTIVVENGHAASIGAEGLAKEGRFPSGRVHTFAGKTIAPLVLRERESLAENGIAMVVVRVDAAGALVGEAHVATRGVVDAQIDRDLVSRARSEIRAAIGALGRGADDAAIAEAARLAVRRSLGKDLGYRPAAEVFVARS